MAKKKKEKMPIGSTAKKDFVDVWLDFFEKYKNRSNTSDCPLTGISTPDVKPTPEPDRPVEPEHPDYIANYQEKEYERGNRP